MLRSPARWFALVAVLASVAPSAARAWPELPYVNVPVCKATGQQSHAQVVPDGVGGWYVAWTDARGGSNTAVYAQRVDSSGSMKWAANGVMLVGSINIDYPPFVVSDGAHGLIVVWNQGTSTIRAQRIDSTGTPLWTPGGVVVRNDTSWSMYAASDGAGGVVISIYDLRTGGYGQLWAQKLDAAGALKWGTYGTLVLSSSGSSLNLADPICCDGSGGAIMGWLGGSTSAYWIAAQRIDATGATRWPTDGIQLSKTGDGADEPRMAYDGAGGAVIVWHGTQGRAQRVNAAGSVRWTSGGVPLGTFYSNGWTNFSMCGAGPGEVIAAWTGPLGSGYGLFAQRLDSTGVARWTTGGVTVASPPAHPYPSVAASDGARGIVVAWFDWRATSGLPDLYVQHVDSTGTALWRTNGIGVCTTHAIAENDACVASDGGGGAFLAWPDARASATGFDIYAQRIGADGAYLGPEPRDLMVRDYPNDQGGKVRLQWTASYLDTLPTLGVYEYGIWRQVPDGTAARALAHGATRAAAGGIAQPGMLRVTRNGARALYWEGVGTVSARGAASYTFTVPTYQDSVAGSHPFTTFMVDASLNTWSGFEEKNACSSSHRFSKASL